MRTVAGLVSSCLILALAAAPAYADRAGRWEATAQIIGSSSESSGAEMASGLDVDSDIGFAFGFAYNFNEHLAMGMDFSFLNPDYEATLETDDGDIVTIDHEMDVFNGHLYGAWNFMQGPFTPYVTAGLGWTYVDSNVSDGLPSTGCWWDPWWGYVCANFYDTYDDTRFSYGAGAGLRYEFGNGMFMKGSYNLMEIDGEGNGADPSFDMWRLEFGWQLGGW